MFFYPATIHLQSCTLNVNKIDVVICFLKLICAFSLTCFKIHMCKISDKSDMFSLNYSNLFKGPLFFGTQCIFTHTLPFYYLGTCTDHTVWPIFIIYGSKEVLLRHLRPFWGEKKIIYFPLFFGKMRNRLFPQC